MEDRPFYSALAHLNTMYGMEMNEDVFENIAMHAWDQIGNKKYMVYNFKGTVKDNKLDLPCNTDIIEGVFAEGESVRWATGVFNDGEYLRNRYMENDIELQRNKTEVQTSSGHLEDYVRDGNTLRFINDGMNVTVIYKGVLVDEQGLPTLNFKEIDAICKYLVFTDLQKKFLMTKDKATFEAAQLFRQQWQFAVDDARTPILLNQNDMDNILNVQSSWDRKRFGLTFKIYR